MCLLVLMTERSLHAEPARCGDRQRLFYVVDFSHDRSMKSCILPDDKLCRLLQCRCTEHVKLMDCERSGSASSSSHSVGSVWVVTPLMRPKDKSTAASKCREWNECKPIIVGTTEITWFEFFFLTFSLNMMQNYTNESFYITAAALEFMDFVTV